MIEPEVRPARQADLPGVLALYRQLKPSDPVLDLETAEPVWSALLSSGLTTPFVAEKAGLLVSTCTLAIVPNLSRGARPYGVIENVVTHLDHRHTGLRGHPRSVTGVVGRKIVDGDCQNNSAIDPFGKPGLSFPLPALTNVSRGVATYAQIVAGDTGDKLPLD